MMTPLFRRGAMVTALLCASIASAHAQQPATAIADPRSVPELRSEFDRAAGLGVPVDPLVAKARLGFLSNASTPRIRAAVRSLTDRMVRANDALKPVHGVDELVAGADALSNGISEGVLRDLRAAQKSRSLQVPIGALTELVVRGVPVKQAAANITRMLARGVPDAQIASVGTGVQGDVAAGVAPSVAMDLRSRSVLSLPLGSAQGAVAPQTIRPPR